MKTVRQFSRIGPCLELGPLLRETDARLYYHCQHGYEAFVSKKSALVVHLFICERASVLAARASMRALCLDEDDRERA